MKRILTVALAGLVVLAAAGAALAMGLGGPLGFRGGCGERADAVIEEFGLTEEQLAELRAIDAAFFNQSLELKNRLLKAQFELRQLLWTRERDQAAIDAKREELADIQEAMRQLQAERQEQVLNVLTDEQKELLNQRQDKLRQRMGRMRKASVQFNNRAQVQPAGFGVGF